MMSRKTLCLAACLGLGLLLPACGGGTQSPGSGGASPGSGGAVASGGEVSSGGAAGSGGDPGSGGDAGSGGTVATSGWEEVRCWQNDTVRGCYARLGNLWTVVVPMCDVEGEPHDPMTQNQEFCSEPDVAAGWDETWCSSGSCFGRLGDWGTSLYASCQMPGGLEQTPTEALCDAAPEEPTGWEGVQCHTSDNPTVETDCYGLRGLYFPAGGLLPTCALEALFAGKPYIVEIPPDTACD